MRSLVWRLAFIFAVSASGSSTSVICGTRVPCSGGSGAGFGVSQEDGAPGIPGGAAWERAPGAARAKGAIGRSARSAISRMLSIAVRSSTRIGSGAPGTGPGAGPEPDMVASASAGLGASGGSGQRIGKPGSATPACTRIDAS